MKKFKSKNILGFFFQWLFVLSILLFPMIVKWVCETELATLQNCRRKLSNCLYCEEHPWFMGCYGNECDGVNTVNWCWDEEYLYNLCMQQNQWGGRGNWNTSWWSVGWWNTSWWNGSWWSAGWWNTSWWNGNWWSAGWWNTSWWSAGNWNTSWWSAGWWSWWNICSWDTIMPEWWTSASDCTWCADWTKASPDNTKCICDSSVKCCWIKLNTVVPFIWDCIELDSDSTRSDTTSVNSVTAFPILMQWLMKIVMSVIMVFSFIMLIVAWLMMTAWAFKNTSFDKWKTILKNVIISLILLWCSWLILSLINPSFFGG